MATLLWANLLASAMLHLSGTVPVAVHSSYRLCSTVLHSTMWLFFSTSIFESQYTVPLKWFDKNTTVYGISGILPSTIRNCPGIFQKTLIQHSPKNHFRKQTHVWNNIHSVLFHHCRSTRLSRWRKEVTTEYKRVPKFVSLFILFFFITFYFTGLHGILNDRLR